MQPSNNSRGFPVAFRGQPPLTIGAATEAAARLVREITRQPSSVVEAFLASDHGLLLGQQVAEQLAAGLPVDRAVTLTVREWAAREIADGEYAGYSYLRVKVGQFAPPRKMAERYRRTLRLITDAATERDPAELVTINAITALFEISYEHARTLLHELELAPDTTAIRQGRRGQTAWGWQLGRVVRAFHQHYSTLVERADANDPVRRGW